jgi:hypothetical protein
MRANDMISGYIRSMPDARIATHRRLCAFSEARTAENVFGFRDMGTLQLLVREPERSGVVTHVPESCEQWANIVAKNADLKISTAVYIVYIYQPVSHVSFYVMQVLIK